MFRKTGLTVAGMILSLWTSGDAAASGFQLREQSGTGQGTSFAGMTAGGEDISAMFFNPAALGAHAGSAVLGVASRIAPVLRFKDGRATRPSGAATSGASTHDDAGKDAVLPSFYAAWDFGKPVRFGLAVNVPFGLETDYTSDWVGRYHATQSAIRTIAVAPTMSYEPIPGLVLGAAPVFQRIEAKLGKAVNVSAILGAGGDAYSNLRGDDSLATGGRFGVLWQATRDTRLGLAYHTEIRHELRGDATFSGNTPAVLVNNNTLRNSPIRANVALPETASFGLQHRLTPELTLAAEAAFTRWSKVNELRIRFESGRADDVTQLRWRDTYFLSVGAVWKARENLTLRTGIGFDKSPVPEEERTPRIPDQDRTWLSFGAGYKLTEAIDLDLGYSHIFVKRANLNLVDGGAASETNRFRGNLTGAYEASIDIVTVQARWRF